MKTPPELDPALTGPAREQRLKLVGPSNIAHYYHLDTARETQGAGYEHVSMLCGLQLAFNELETRAAPGEGCTRLVCAACYESAQWYGNKPNAQVFPALRLAA